MTAIIAYNTNDKSVFDEISLLEMLMKSRAGSVTLNTNLDATSMKLSLMIRIRYRITPNANIKNIGIVIEKENTSTSKKLFNAIP